jgi:hypothetical protein
MGTALKFIGGVVGAWFGLKVLFWAFGIIASLFVTILLVAGVVALCVGLYKVRARWA